MITKKKLSIIVIILIVFFSISSIALAKYHQKSDDGSLYEAEEFYFNSNLLFSDNIPSYTYRDGEDSISIELKNNEDELRYTSLEISYLVEITDLNGNNIKNKDGVLVGSIEGSLASGKSNKTILFDNLKAGSYKVTATSISPYKQVLQGIFYLGEIDEEITYSVNDAKDSSVLQLTISTSSYGGEVNITIPNDLYPDNTDINLQNVDITNNKSFNINFKPFSEYTFIFFKNNPDDVYNNSDFKIKKVVS